MSEDLEIKYNPKKIKEIWQKYNLTVVILLLAAIFLAGFFRAYPYDLPITDDWAESTIRSNIQNQVASNIRGQYSNLDENTFNNLVQQQTNLYLNQNKDQVEAQKKQISEQIKAQYQDESGQTYLLAIDPYHYYRQAANILENGHVGDKLVDGSPYDDHMLAPIGRPISNSLHPITIAAVHQISSIFGNSSLLSSAFFVPMLISMLAIIPCFFLGKRIGGNVTGATAAILLALHPVLLGRTPAGFSDTDAYNILFPLLITWLFFESLISKKPRNKLLLASGAGLATGLFAFAWYGWWYIFDIIIGSIALYLIYMAIKYKKNTFKVKKIKSFLFTSISYILSALIFVVLFTNFNNLLLTIEGPLSSIFIKQAAHTTLWPNVYTTVAELNEVSVKGIIDALGGSIIFAISIIGIFLVLLKKKDKDIRLKYFFLLAIWFIAAIFGSTKGMRFILLLLPPFVLGVGITTSYLFIKLRKWLNKDLEINKKFITTIFILALIALSIPWINKAEVTANSEVPSMNDAWYSALTKIKDESQEDAIINSWWDFGHWFKAIGDRAVTFDGASQNQPQAHWIGKTLLTSDEDEAKAILRMLDCGGNEAYNLLLEETNDPLKTKRVIDEIILLEENEAKEILSEHISNPDRILEKTHCTPPENYFITSEDMVSKAGVWAHFGSWDFERSFAYNTINSKNKNNAISTLRESLDYTQEEAESVYRQLNGLSDKEANAWIAPYPSFGQEANCQLQNDTAICGGIKIELEENKAYINTNEGLIEIKTYRDDQEVYESDSGDDSFAVAYIPEENRAVFMDPLLLNSVFTELYYYGGKNLDNFELFDTQIGINGFQIYTWKVKW